jgi:hypothetical protein
LIFFCLLVLGWPFINYAIFDLLNLAPWQSLNHKTIGTK